MFQDVTVLSLSIVAAFVVITVINMIVDTLRYRAELRVLNTIAPEFVQALQTIQKMQEPKRKKRKKFRDRHFDDLDNLHSEFRNFGKGPKTSL